MSDRPSAIVAIDPGASGGIAVWRGGGVYVERMPKDEDALHACFRANVGEGVPVYIEKVGGYVAGKALPGSAMFNFGYNYGLIVGLCVAHGVRCVRVPPKEWQKRLNIGTKSSCSTQAEWKRRLREEAALRFPRVMDVLTGRPAAVTLCTADALLLLDYAMEKNCVQ